MEIAHLNDIIDIAGRSFPVAWTAPDFTLFLTHSCSFSFGAFHSKLRAYFIGLLVQGDLDVISVATAPEARAHGLAEGLLRRVCESPEVTRVFLEVDAENQAALGLYTKVGFQIQGLRKKYYAEKRDALVMRWMK